MPAPQHGESLARLPGAENSHDFRKDFAITVSTTPNAENIITARLVQPAKESAGFVSSTVVFDEFGEVESADRAVNSGAPAEDSKKPTKPESYSLQDILDVPNNSFASVSGTVVVAPGVFGKRIMYISDARDALQIYFHSGMFPKFALGQLVTVSGTVSRAGGEGRLKIKNATDVTIIPAARGGPTQKVTAQGQNSLEIVAADGAVYAQVSGQITEKTGKLLYVDDGIGEVAVYAVALSKEDLRAAKVGDDVSVAGIYRPTAGKNGTGRLYALPGQFTVAPREDPHAGTQDMQELKGPLNAQKIQQNDITKQGGVLGQKAKAWIGAVGAAIGAIGIAIKVKSLL